MTIFGIAPTNLFFYNLHLFKFVLAVTTCALYGIDLDRNRRANVRDDGRWVYAEVVGVLSAVTTILYCVPYILRFSLVWAWNTIIFFLWIALFGIFGKMFINVDARGNKDIQRMKNAVWVVLASAILWLIGSIAHFIYWRGHRDRRSRFTSRARV